MTHVPPIQSGAVQDAVNILRGDYADEPAWRNHASCVRAAAAVSQMLQLYWSDDWPTYMQRRPDHIPENLWEQWGLENEIIALRSALNEAHQRIATLRAQRDDSRTREIKTDADIAAFVRSSARESARLEADANRYRRESIERMGELRKALKESERFQKLARERGGTDVP